ncbi:MAG: LPS export ABC transporter permease LptF [Hydrogenophaga sp.]|jgi:lipopolysaccharide export system permease protein|uniref:LPS export ABC transporter permease LptF n=1 Tax=Hydrogenophaga sp. TaxID=1904254 RepID=UPI000EE4DDDF|nr:LPS export ABC transporter permease LptF [Hydrogenophaga sp.]MDD3784770.1 LPS export ABC transporter permease LptF [Hydrogenophaga sp.]MDX9970020.1 LPS export ABC transporter permease LptF [Hydrogenophaga sp.]HAJ12358.1 LPS export ABC transporter permease LptF [Comamonadaceae bacterium]
MLFHSSLRKELARSFGATLVVLFTIVLTMLLIRTLGMASKGSVNPEEIMLVLGYTVLGRMPTILTLALFISIVSTLSRMYRDSEMIIWFSSGRSLGGFLGPLMRFSWPILVVISLMVLFVWPWANQQTDELRQRFETRGDLQRVQPGQFQESSNGRRVFFIDKDSVEGQEGRNVFISSVDNEGVETVISAASGRIETINDTPFLVLNKGQRLEIPPGSRELRLSEFEEYAAQIGASRELAEARRDLNAVSTLDLLTEPTPPRLGELGWRIGVALSAFNLVLMALAVTVSNPRAGKGGNLLFTLFAFIAYFNFLNFGQRWVSAGQVSLGGLLLVMHGSVAAWSLIWLYKRHYNLDLKQLMLRLFRPRKTLEEAA